MVLERLFHKSLILAVISSPRSDQNVLERHFAREQPIQYRFRFARMEILAYVCTDKTPKTYLKIRECQCKITNRL